MSAFLGMKGTGDWADDQRPKNWREGILYEYPNGSAPLTAMMSMMKESSVDDPEFYWWTKSLPVQGGGVTAGEIYTDALMSAAAGDTGVAGDIKYVKVAESVADHFRAGHQAMLRDTSDYDVDVNVKVVAVQKNGASSCITVKLLEDDDNSATHGISDVDRILIIGNLNPEGGAMPDSIQYDPTKIYNKTQIFRSPLEITRTARLTRLRTGDAYKEVKREALEMHSIEMEKAFIWGIMTENTGDNGKIERTTRGLINIIRTYASENVSDYSLDTDFSGETWLAGGEEWLDNRLRLMFRYGRNEKMVFCGDGALLAINRLAKSSGQFTLTAQTMAYGINVTTWQTPFGKIYLKTHPLFSYETTNQYSMVVFEPEELKYRYITDTKFYADPDKQNTGWTRRDGTSEEFLTEAGMEFHFPTGWGYLNGVGKDNAV